MSRCSECGRHDDLKDEIRALLAIARRRSNATTTYGRECALMVPYYERALAALEEASATWDSYIRSLRPRTSSVQPEPDPLAATGTQPARGFVKADASPTGPKEGAK
jgi:hypothetical protein